MRKTGSRLTPLLHEIGLASPAKPTKATKDVSVRSSVIVVLLGVSGSGKTTIGKLLAKRLDCPFYDADELHSARNVSKMARGLALTDQDREPWLVQVKELMQAAIERKETAVFACSALKESYRLFLARGTEGVQFYYLKGEPDLIKQRLAGRKNHFMNPELLESQFDSLEEPTGAPALDIALEPDAIVGLILEATEKSGWRGGGRNSELLEWEE